MFSPFERLVAFRYLRARKAEGFVSVIAGFSFIGILLGVATLIIVMSVMNGFRAELFSRILGINGHMNVYAPGGPLTDYDYLRSIIAPMPGIAQVTPIIEGQALLSRSGLASGVMVRGMAWEDFRNRTLLRDSIVSGTLDDYEDNALAIGKVLADKFHLKPGDTITLTSPQVKSTPFGSLPRQRSFKIAMVFDVQMHEYNAGFVFMPLDSAQTFFQMQGAVTTMEIFLKNADTLDDMRRTIALAVKDQAAVYDWRDSNKSFFNALQVERNVMFLILTMIILVAAFNIISSMIMLVKDKGPDIAIMRTMGASRASMMKIFILTGASIGVAGTAFGAAAGIAFALNIESVRQWLQSLTGTNLFSAEIYFLSKLPAQVEWHEVLSVVIMALTLSVLATLYPAWRAARLDPVEALRDE
ncbi:MAG: lipoprotein-releasing ABC transporter permease subunit [Alphaproteobacteria bacterium]|nr:lipoprotein-releasing ABC transporter permease subunit [Alphaproteobacteria bacterium]